MENLLMCAPAVFAVGEEYQITVPVTASCLLSVTVGTETYYDHVNGVLRSDTDVHRVTVPMENLDRAGAYEVHLLPCPERKSYYTTLGEEQVFPFSFRPVPNDNLRIFFMSDTHCRCDSVLRAAKTGGEYDMIVFGGDIANDSGAKDAELLLFRLCAEIGKGEIPTVAVRGNHDNRGLRAEKILHYYPSRNGKTYYTVHLGPLFFLVLDCGEDKRDACAEYGGVNCFEYFRREETKWLRDVADAVRSGTGCDGIRYRLASAHIPFTHKFDEGQFDIENELYDEWTGILNRIGTQLLISGHTHCLTVQRGARGADFNTVTCSEMRGQIGGPDDFFAGTRFVLKDGKIMADFCDSNVKITPCGIF